MTVDALALQPQALLDIANGLAAAGLAVDASEPARWYVRLLATDTYEAWLLGWPPGSRIEPHDHGPSHGAFVVVRGSLAEWRWDGGEPRRRVFGCGDAATVPPGVVHGVEAAGGEPAGSIHVYSPPLSEMRFYGDDGTTVVGVEAVGG